MIWLILLVVILVVAGVFLVTSLFGAPFVPSKYKGVQEAFRKLRPLTKEDVVVDFGCGGGVVLRAVADLDVKRVVGIELNPVLAVLTKCRSRGNEKIQVKCGNMLTMKLPKDMTVAYIFGLDRVMRMLKPRLVKYAREQGRDIWIVSLAFEFAGMKPEKKWGAYRLYRIRG
jgi:SAM-dependent methyltransferase